MSAGRSSGEEDEAAGEFLLLLEEETATVAGKVEQKVKRVPSTVTVLTREDIRLSGATHLPDLLRMVPGIDVVVATAADSSLGIRGQADPIDQTMMLLIDGRTAYLDFVGTVLFENLPLGLEEIERIEIIRGPSSTLWGANAASGVINVITRRPKDLAGTTVSAYGAELRTHGGTVIQAGQHGRLGYSVSAGYGTAGSWDDGDGKALSPPRASAKVEWDAGEGTMFTGHAGYAALDGLLIGDIGNLDRDGGQAYLMGVFTMGGLTARGYVNRTDGTVGFTLLGYEADVEASTYSLDAFHSWSFARSQLTVGGEYRRLEAESDLANGGEPLGLDLWSLYAQDVLRLGSRAELTVGLRYDRHPLTDPQPSPRLGFVVEPADGHVLRANYATAFRNPSLTEFYVDFTFSEPYQITLLPNLDLEPERSATVELGYRFFHRDRLALDVTLWRQKFYDPVFFNVVGYVPGTDIPNAFQLENLVDSNTGSGAEVALRARLAPGLQAIAGYTYQDVAIDEQTGLVERWPRNKVSAALRYVRPEGFEGQIFVQHVGRWTVEEGGLPSYTSVWAKVGYAFLDGKVALHLFGQNLLDDEHREFPSGETLGRRVGAQVTLHFPR